MAKNEVGPPKRAVSILVGILVGCVLAYAYQVNLPTLFYEMNVATLVAFAAVPMLTGFITALLQPEMALKNSIITGFISGLFNSVIATIKMIYTSPMEIAELYAFSVFAVFSVFVWMILAGAVALLAAKIYE